MNLPSRDHPLESAAPEQPQPQALDCTHAEARLIERLRLQRCLAPGDFVVNYAVGPYQLRLYCPNARLALEIEACDAPGSSAQAEMERTDASALRRAARDSFLQSVGIEVLRVSEEEIDSAEELEALIVRIAGQVERRMRAQRESAGRKRLTSAPHELSPRRSFA